MDSSWWDVVVPMIVAVLVLAVPGFVVGAASGASTRVKVIGAPLVSVTCVAVGAIVADLVGLPWGVVAVLLVTVVLSLLALLLRIRRPRPADPRQSNWSGQWGWTLLALVVGGAVQGVRMTRAMGSSSAISQTYDATFHLNLIRWILDTRSGSSLHAKISSIDSGQGFYPAAWHDVVSLIVQTTHAGIPEAANAMSLAISTVLWPLGVAVLCGVLARSWTFAAAGALLAGAFPQMPNLLTWFGVLYPNILGYALLPFVLALLVLALLPRTGLPRRQAWAFLLVGAPGLALAHPSAVFSVFVLSFPLVAQAAIEWCASATRRRPRPVRWIAGVTGLGGVVVLFFGLDRLSMKIELVREMRQSDSFWTASSGLVNAIGRFIGTNTGYMTQGSGWVPWILAPLVLVGMVRALWMPLARWLPFAYIISGALFTIALSGSPEMRAYFTGPWYGDTQRLVALVGITQVPLLVVGIRAVCEGIGWLFARQWTGRASRWAGRLFVGGVCVVFVIAQVGANLGRSFDSIRASWTFQSAENPEALLSQDEYRLLERLPEDVPADDTLIGNPWNGSALALALGDRMMVFPHVVTDNDEEADFVAEYLDQAKSLPSVCEMTDSLRIRYVLDFGRDYLWGQDPRSAGYQGLDGLVEDGVATVVDQEGEARLLEITACAQP